jgi:hypothetical protein
MPLGGMARRPLGAVTIDIFAALPRSANDSRPFSRERRQRHLDGNRFAEADILYYPDCPRFPGKPRWAFETALRSSSWCNGRLPGSLTHAAGRTPKMRVY